MGQPQGATSVVQQWIDSEQSLAATWRSAGKQLLFTSLEISQRDGLNPVA